MPPQRSRKYRERIELALLIESIGVKMPQCSYCEKHSRDCIVSEGNSARCNECVRRGTKCDVEGPSANDIASLLREQDRLDREEEETTSKLLRLQKQKKFLRQRATQMVQRGLKTLDELDEVEEKEKREAARQKEAEHNELCAVNLAGSGEGLDLGGPSSDLPPLSQQEWQAMMDFADETPSVSQSS